MSDTIEKYVPEKTAAYKLCMDSIEYVVDRFNMKEVHGEDGGAYHKVLFSRGGKEVGEQRIWLGNEGVFKIVYVGLVANPPGVDSHMMFAYTPADSPVPHFTVDSVHLAHMGHYSFHGEIMPRVDLGMNLEYIDHVYTPLDEANKAVYNTEGVAKTEELKIRQWALMSPWMLAGRAASLEAFQSLDEHVATYREHWANLVENGIPDECLKNVDMSKLAERDRINREAAFNRDVDPVYNQLVPLMGIEEGDRQIQVMRCQDGIYESGDHLKLNLF